MLGFAVSGSAVSPRSGGPVELPHEYSSSPRPGSSARADDTHVEISPEAELLGAQSGLLRVVFGAVEHEVSPAGRVAFEHAGRSEYLGSTLSEPGGGIPDLSPEATARRILGGIQGYIYRAFMAQHPGATPEDFERFKAEVVRGVEHGMGEARSILAGLALFDNDLATEVERTETLVREGLAEFFTEEGQHFDRAAA